MLVDKKLGRYRVLEPIGNGGMATVFAGEHELLGQRVAIKLLHAKHVNNVPMVRRFHNEARTIAALDHHGIVKLFDIGQTSDGRAYVVMELLRGETLRERIGDEGVAATTAVTFAQQIASAVQAAHEAGIIHRDLKPENVFIVPDADIPTGERVKILDFGIAKRTRISSHPITRTGILIGTPSYMSPEQCHGGMVLDARADVYSLGVLLYEMLAGSLPFSSEKTDELISQHLYCAPSELSEVAPDVPADVAAIAMRCLAKEPDERYGSMADVADALAAVDHDELMNDRPDTLPVMLASTDTLSDGFDLDDAVTSLRTRPTSRFRLLSRSRVAIATITLAVALGGVAAAWMHDGSTRAATPSPVTKAKPAPEFVTTVDATVPRASARTESTAVTKPGPASAPIKPESGKVAKTKPKPTKKATRRRSLRRKQFASRRARARSKPSRPTPPPKPTKQPAPAKERFDDVDTPAVY